MTPATTSVFEAKHTRLQNDLFWEGFTPSEWEKGKHIMGEKLNWTGYNDAYWWDNVATNIKFTRQRDSKNRLWQLDPVNNTVTLIKE